MPPQQVTISPGSLEHAAHVFLDAVLAAIACGTAAASVAWILGLDLGPLDARGRDVAVVLVSLTLGPVAYVLWREWLRWRDNADDIRP